jgi:hypothetical protein
VLDKMWRSRRTLHLLDPPNQLYFEHFHDWNQARGFMSHVFYKQYRKRAEGGEFQDHINANFLNSTANLYPLLSFASPKTVTNPRIASTVHQHLTYHSGV